MLVSKTPHNAIVLLELTDGKHVIGEVSSWERSNHTVVLHRPCLVENKKCTHLLTVDDNDMVNIVKSHITMWSYANKEMLEIYYKHTQEK